MQFPNRVTCQAEICFGILFIDVAFISTQSNMGNNLFVAAAELHLHLLLHPAFLGEALYGYIIQTIWP